MNNELNVVAEWYRANTLSQHETNTNLMVVIYSSNSDINIYIITHIVVAKIYVQHIVAGVSNIDTNQLHSLSDLFLNTEVKSGKLGLSSNIDQNLSSSLQEFISGHIKSV